MCVWGGCRPFGRINNQRQWRQEQTLRSLCITYPHAKIHVPRPCVRAPSCTFVRIGFGSSAFGSCTHTHAWRAARSYTTVIVVVLLVIVVVVTAIKHFLYGSLYTSQTVKYIRFSVRWINPTTAGGYNDTNKRTKQLRYNAELSPSRPLHPHTIPYRLYYYYYRVGQMLLL